MELLHKLFGDLLNSIYHCFDGIVIHYDRDGHARWGVAGWHRPNSKLEAAYYKADRAIEELA